MTGAVTRALIDSADPGSIASRARRGRWEVLQSHFPSLELMTVLDLGGTADFWRSAPVRPAHVTLLNLAGEACDEPWLDFVRGDACDAPLAGRYDLVVSNSLLEHVGGHWRRQQLADEIDRLSDHHWVQTPYRYFPVEPHWLFPGFQFLPVGTKSKITERWPLGFMQVSRDAAVRQALETELVSISELRHYFPDSLIWKERFGGLVKSIVAIRAPSNRSSGQLGDPLDVGDVAARGDQVDLVAADVGEAPQ